MTFLKLREDRPATIQEHQAPRMEVNRLRQELATAADRLEARGHNLGAQEARAALEKNHAI